VLRSLKTGTITESLRYREGDPGTSVVDTEPPVRASRGVSVAQDRDAGRPDTGCPAAVS
jgi:hypothetical protein